MDRNNFVANRLINEKSPYLLQHAHNPVDWYPWGDEAFLKAIKEDKPIFLSIGYSTCHWCHVMERESFEDEDVAKVLNDNFVSIKVDREERPDIDSVYMDVCQALTGSGGWPMTIIMTPNKKPFFAGTYIPKNSRYGMMGLIDLLNTVSKIWKKDKEKLLRSSEEIVREIRTNYDKGEKGEIDEEDIHKTFSHFSSAFDSIYGGFGNAPKFPTPHSLYFLLRYYKMNDSKAALDMVTKTLDSMYKGGIFDHIGFGFSRYSTDKKWLVPHFEKMLYDNALLAVAYAEAFLATGEKLYKEVCEKIFSYILRDMSSEDGGFYSAEDADSEGEEGKFYIWTYDEVINLLGKEDGELFCRCYDITPNGNFQNKNIPNLISQSIDEIENDKMLKDKLEDLRDRLFKCREKRIHPHKDDKILTSWNGLMIAALAICGKVFQNKTYIEKAEKACRFIFENLIKSDGRLQARFREGEAAHLAYLDDYSFLIWGLIELYEATFKADYLKKAISLNEDMYKYFWDKENGGFYLYGEDSEELIWRPKEIYDGALPSGNSVAALNMLRLGRLTGNLDLEERAVEIFKTFGKKVKDMPTAYAYFMCAFMYYVAGGKEVVVSGHKNNKEVESLINKINTSYDPFTVVILNDGDDTLKEIAPITADKGLVDGKPAVYICENFACQKPITDFYELFK